MVSVAFALSHPHECVPKQSATAHTYLWEGLFLFFNELFQGYTLYISSEFFETYHKNQGIMRKS